MEAFSALPRKEKVKEFRRRAQQVQCRKESGQIEGYMQIAKKLGKLDSMEKHLEDSIYHSVTHSESKLWDEVVRDMSTAGSMGFYCARVTNATIKK